MTIGRLSGLPLTLFMLGVVYFGGFALGDLLDPAARGLLVRRDLALSGTLVAARSPAMLDLFTLVTAFGRWTVVVPMALGIGALLWLSRREAYVPGFWLALAGNQITVNTIKPLFARARPDLAQFGELSFSFPSGHSAIALAFFGYLTWLALRERLADRRVTLLAGALAVLMVGTSRLVLGQHYPSDVLGGYLVGAFWAAAGAWVAGRSTSPAQHLAPRARALVSLVVVGVTGVVVWLTAQAYLAGLVVLPAP